MGAADVEEPEAAQRSESSVAFRSELAATRWLAVEMTGSPKFLGDPNDPFAHALRLRRDGAFQTVDAEASLFRTTAWPLLRERQRLSQ